VNVGIVRPDKKYFYFPKKLNLLWSDGRATVNFSHLFHIVMDWEESPFSYHCSGGKCPGSIQIGQDLFSCGYRKGLIGRDLLRHPVAVVLNGKKKRTELG